MIRKIRLKNFKCFEELDLSAKNVNVYTGINGMGKSTIIQSMLLLRQSYYKEKAMKGLCLNGKYVSLGNAQDVLYEKAIDDIIGLGISSDEGNYYWDYQYVQDSDFLPLTKGEKDSYIRDIFGKRFSYISAFRIEPRELYRIENEEEEENREFGNNGEYALQYLDSNGDKQVVNENVIIEDKLGKSLMNQTRMWMDKIAPGVAPMVSVNTRLRNAEVKYEFVEGTEKTNSYKSMNVGFGITYVLPLVIALLSAQKGDVIVMENPEAHIHPAGQRALADMIALAGAGGVQVFVETHSDHIINGIRLAVKNKKIRKDEVQISFFYKDKSDGYRHKYLSPQVKEDGRLDYWPEGFFDEWDKALYELM